MYLKFKRIQSNFDRCKKISSVHFCWRNKTPNCLECLKKGIASPETNECKSIYGYREQPNSLELCVCVYVCLSHFFFNRLRTRPKHKSLRVRYCQKKKRKIAWRTRKPHNWKGGEKKNEVMAFKRN